MPGSGLPGGSRMAIRQSSLRYYSHQISGAQIYFKKGMVATLRVDRKKWTKEMKGALGLPGYRVKPAVMITKAAPVPDFLFPHQLSPRQTETSLTIPAVNFTEAAPSVKKIFNELEAKHIYMFTDIFLVTKFREIIKKKLDSRTEL